MKAHTYKTNSITPVFQTNPIKILSETLILPVQKIKMHFSNNKPLTEEILGLVEEWLRFYFRKHGKRYEHSISTGDVAEEIARTIGYNSPMKARLVGMIHDIAKTPVRKILKKANKEKIEKLSKKLKNLGIELLDSELVFHEVKKVNIKNLHAPFGMLMAAKHFGIKDSEILNAIRYHTIGFEVNNMDVLSNIIVLADKIEPVKRGYDLYNEIIDILRVTKDIEITLNALRNKL